MARPDLSHVPEWYHGYISQVTGDDLTDVLLKSGKNDLAVLKAIPTEQWNYAYDTGKWTIREVVQHILDAERVFVYRALSFSRMDPTPLPGFDEEHWARFMDCNQRPPAELIAEFEQLRASTVAFFKSLSTAQLAATGKANNNEIYVEAIGFIVAGHSTHHIRIIRERYL